MTLKRSTAMVNAQASQRVEIHAVSIGANLAFANNGASPDTITDSDSGLITDGFRVGDAIYIFEPTTGANKTGVDGQILSAVAAGVLTFPTGTVDTAEAFEADTVVCAGQGGSFYDLFRFGTLHIYTGSQPADADAAETGSKLVEIQVASGAFTPGTDTNGLSWGSGAVGVISKASEVWSGTAGATGTAGWFRFYTNAEDTGADGGSPFTKIRFDGTVGTSGAQLIVSSTSITDLATVTIDTAALTFPMSG